MKRRWITGPKVYTVDGDCLLEQMLVESNYFSIFSGPVCGDEEAGNGPDKEKVNSIILYWVYGRGGKQEEQEHEDDEEKEGEDVEEEGAAGEALEEVTVEEEKEEEEEKGKALEEDQGDAVKEEEAVEKPFA
ncbi:hypothetical protein Y032_0461g1874 [Ancylostoma ceylanicum]|uniref:Uncharacterized protein n=2 Tax=Ancylostoma ceylanicum TaxID=53326 RepID=A0A016WZH4_9BILA|nr:hypothetical protein Y032_0461g1874 [Ancylostoma ceylanicum]